MNLEKFHTTYLKHLNEKAHDVVRIVALEANNERWFQAEMVLAFCGSEDSGLIFSSEYYNKYADELEWSEWDDCVGQEGIITTEADIYIGVKTGKYESSNVRKVDFLLEKPNALVLDEIKIIWLCYQFKNSPYDYLQNKKVLDDAWRLRKNLAKNLVRDHKRLSRYITLICIDDCNFLENASNLKKIIVDEFNNYLEKIVIDKKKHVRLDKILTDGVNYPEIYKNTDEKDTVYDIHLMTIEIPY